MELLGSVPAAHATHECVLLAMQPRDGRLDNASRTLSTLVVAQWLAMTAPKE